MPPPKKTMRPSRPLALGTEVLTTAEAAEDCNVSVRTIYRAIKSGKLKAGHPFNAGHPASSMTCREGLMTLPWQGQLVDL